MSKHISYNPHELICREGESSSDLFYLQEGKLLICTVHGTQVKAIARIEANEFFGELSFFDGRHRSTYIVTLEKSMVIQISKKSVMEHLPYWFVEVGKNLTKKIRLLDEIVHESNFKKIGAEDQKPLSIEEQREIFAAIKASGT